jgi:hypothetical protein
MNAKPTWRHIENQIKHKSILHSQKPIVMHPTYTSKTPSHFFLCIFWSLIRLEKSCSLKSQWYCKTNNLHNLKSTLQHVIIIIIGWKLLTNLSLLNVSVTMSFYIVIIMTMCYIQKVFDMRPFSYTYNIAKLVFLKASKELEHLTINECENEQVVFNFVHWLGIYTIHIRYIH